MQPIDLLSSAQRHTPQLDTPQYEDASSLQEDLRAPPVLVPPDQIASGYFLIDVINGICAVRETMLNTTIARLETLKAEIKEASSQLILKLKEAAQQARNHDFWSQLKKIANSLLSALSAVCGLSLIGSGGSALVGGALIASGLLSLSNLILSECGGWEWVADHLAQENEERKDKLLQILPAAIGLIAGGFGLAGSVYGITSGALDFTQKAGGIAQTALTLFSGATQLGKGVSDAQLTWTQADLTLAEDALHLKQESYARLTDETHATLEEFNRTFQQAKSAVRTAVRTQSQLTR